MIDANGDSAGLHGRVVESIDNASDGAGAVVRPLNAITNLAFIAGIWGIREARKRNAARAETWAGSSCLSASAPASFTRSPTG